MKLPRQQALKSPYTPFVAGVLCAITLFLTVLLPQEAQAGTTVSLYKSFAGNINFVTTGGTLRTADNGTNPCSVTTSSSAPLAGIPAGSTIVAAYVYYAASDNTADASFTFNGNALTADRTFTDTTVVPFYSGFKDVTSFVAGNGTYTFSGITINTGATWCGNQTVLGGWALVVIYSNNTTESNRVINVFDGFQAFQNSSITLTPNNFQIPSTGINGKFAVITWEGDPTLSGNETLEYKGNVLTDNCNGANNQYNSTINTLTCTGIAATDDVYYGVDIDTFDISSYLVAGDTSGSTFYQSGQDAVLLSAQIVSVSNTPVADLSIIKVHNGTFGFGDNGTYTLTVKNNGPATETGTVTVTDTLPTGLTYVSAAGIGWVCGFATPTVTCTNANAGGLANGASFPAITLTVTVQAGAPASVSNTATVSGALFDNDSTNSSSTDTVAPVQPDLSTSTKTVINTGGGDAVVGSTLQYTITLTETAGVQATNASVTDDIPANVSGFTVTNFPAGSANSSTGSGTGANNTGKLNVTGISIPANGSVTIVFTVQVAAGTANCTNIDNTATVTNPFGPGATPSASTIVVAQSSCAASGNKILYLYDNTGPTYTNLLNRVVQTVNSVVANEVTVGRGANHVWDMNPTVATGKSLVLPAGNVTVTLIETATGVNTGTNRPTTVTLLNNGVAVATSGTVNVANGPTAHNYTIAIPATTVLAGNSLGIQFNNNTGTNNRNIAIAQKTAAQGNSKLTFATSTVINVDSVTAYNAVYPATTITPVYVPNNTVFICAVISDPFGSADVTSANITLTDPNGTTQVSAAAMTAKGATDCSGTANTAAEAYEYTYAIPSNATTGFWTATVTGNEGSEGTVTHTANGSFDVDVPSLLIMKTVSVTSDPVEGATRSKAIPGATVQYTILVQNNGRGPVDTGTFVISDPVPTNTVMSLPAKPPFTFTDGSASSGLSVTNGSDANITYSNNGGATFVYVPACTRPCTDAAITNFKITLTGSMNGKTGGTAPSFTITYNVVIQ